MTNRRHLLGSAFLTLALVASPELAEWAFAQGERLSFLSSGVEIRFTDRGAGEPVVLMHAMLETLDAWESSPVAAGLLEAGFRVIALDIRGFGDSDKPTDAEQYGIEVVHDVVPLARSP